MNVRLSLRKMVLALNQLAYSRKFFEAENFQGYLLVTDFVKLNFEYLLDYHCIAIYFYTILRN